MGAEKKLSVVMIVKNEETLLEACLVSVVGADELIICDTGSTDGTIAIAESFGAKVYTDFTWCDDFAAARNHANHKATGDWILSIDADEVLCVGGIDKISEAISDAAHENTFDVVIKRNGSSVYFSVPRIYKNTDDIFWMSPIHNYLNVVENNKTDIIIIQGYSPAHNGDPDRALRMLKKAVENDPKLVREVYYLAREYWCRKDYVTCLANLDDYLTRAWWGPEWSAVWLLKARCHWALNDLNNAQNSCLQAIKIDANFKEALYFMSEITGPNNSKVWKLMADNASDEFSLWKYRRPNINTKEYWNKKWSTRPEWIYPTYEKIIKLVGDKKALDFGCGRGDLLQHLPNGHGIDLSETAINIVRERGMSGEVGDYPVGSYDVAVCTEVLEHVDDDKQIIQGLFDCADTIIVSVPNNCLPPEVEPEHRRTYTKETITELIPDIKNIWEIDRYLLVLASREDLVFRGAAKEVSV